MSEYQYYEFQKVNDRLSEKEMQELRAYSTRARITSTSFINENHFGSFKGNADLWMEKYFDGYLYLANWGTREVQLALPAKLLPVETMRRYCSSRAASCREKSGKVILTFCSEEEPDGEWLEGEGHLSSLLEIRNEIGRGDLRSLYLGWLMGVQADELTSSVKEPPAPPNLGALSGPQASLAEFFHLDSDLLTVAAQSSPRVKGEETRTKELTAWISSLPVKEKDKMLIRLMAGDASNIGIELQSRFRSQRDKGQTPAAVRPRTAAELLSAAKVQGEAR